MTARIAAGFLVVLTVVLAAVVVPLGIIVTRQQSADFERQADHVAEAVASVAEEHIDDGAPSSGLHTTLRRFAADGYRIAVLDASGTVIEHVGQELPASAIESATSPRPPNQIDDMVISIATVGDANRTLGTVVLARDTQVLEDRRNDLWLLLAGAASGSLLVGTVIAWLLSRWISRPLARLARVVRTVSDPAKRALADEETGPIPIREVATAFNAMTARVDSLLRTQQDMMAEVSHQLRGPLAALRLRLEIQRDELPESQASEVNAMIDETGRLTRMLDGLLAVARADAAPASPTRCHVADIARDRVAAWLPVAADQHIQLGLDAQSVDARLTPGYLEQVLDNLLDNALGATPSGGRIQVGVTAVEDGIDVTVTDTGPGMTADQRAQAVRRWTTDRVGIGGAGLGLAIVTRLVETDHGTVTLADAPAGGLAVRVHYPRMR